MSSLEDLRVLIDEGADTGTIEREEQEMIHSVMDLAEHPRQRGYGAPHSRPRPARYSGA